MVNNMKRCFHNITYQRHVNLKHNLNHNATTSPSEQLRSKADNINYGRRQGTTDGNTTTWGKPWQCILKPNTPMVQQFYS